MTTRTDLSGFRSLFAELAQQCETAAQLTGVDGAAVALFAASRQLSELVYATDPVAQQIDELQFSCGDGPARDAYVHDRPQVCADLDTGAATARWPGFTADAIEIGAAAVFAFPVPGPRRPVGTLELYRRTRGILRTGEHESAALCAAMIGLTVLSSRIVRTAPIGSVEDAITAAARRPADQTDRPGAADTFIVSLLAEQTLTDAHPIKPAASFSRSQVYLASGMIAVQLATSADEGLARLRAYAYANARPITAVATDIIAHRLRMHDHRQI